MEAVSEEFAPARLLFARARAGLTRARLAAQIDVSARSLANYEDGRFKPNVEVIARLANALDVPTTFFYGRALIEIEANAASFRALSKTSAVKRDSALASGAIAIEVSAWLDERLHLPGPDVPTYARGAEDPEMTAVRLRNEWNLGFARVRNAVHLLEAHGVRVFSLPEHLSDVDAFSFWRRDTPFVLLNCRKSAERGRFDAVHELGHLVMHGDYDLPRGRERELEANRFAAAFLMPEEDVRACGLRQANAAQVIEAKRRWGVAAMALTHRLHELGLTSDWTYTTTCRRLSQLGYRSGEPDAGAGPRETSQVLEKAFTLLRERGVGQADVAKALRVHPGTLREHLFGLVMTPLPGGGQHNRAATGHLSLVGPDIPSHSDYRSFEGRGPVVQTTSEGKRNMAKGNVGTYYEDGHWKNKVEGNTRASNTHDTKGEAQRVGRSMAIQRETEHVIKNKDGQIGQKNSYGNDPRKSKG